MKNTLVNPWCGAVVMVSIVFAMFAMCIAYANCPNTATQKIDYESAHPCIATCTQCCSYTTYNPTCENCGKYSPGNQCTPGTNTYTVTATSYVYGNCSGGKCSGGFPGGPANTNYTCYRNTVTTNCPPPG